MGVLHANLPDDQLHNPKGFADADNESVCYKNSSGELEWIGKSAFLNAGMSMITGTIVGTPSIIADAELVGKSKAFLIVDNIFKGIFTILSGLDTVNGELTGITGLEDTQIYFILAI